MAEVKYEGDKYIIIPKKYLEKMALTHRHRIVTLLERMAAMRISEGKDPNPGYFICNQDEPYALDVLNVILRGEERKNRRKK